jgi:hypothetical protein
MAHADSNLPALPKEERIVGDGIIYGEGVSKEKLRAAAGRKTSALSSYLME